jgi:hypothetical protein
MQVTKIISLTLFMAVAMNGCFSATLVKQDALAKKFERVSVIPHGYGDEILEFKRKEYHHLSSAWYVRLMDKNAILFTTRSPEQSHTILHVVPIGDGEEITMDLGDSTAFGAGLGLPKDDPASHYIENIDGDKITFVTKFGTAPTEVRFLVDLKARTFTRLPQPEKAKS